MAAGALFTPSLVDREPFGEPRPWRLPSLYLLAFFGGHLPAAIIAWLNTKRLGLGDDARRRIVWIEVAALTVSIAFVAALALYAWSRVPAGDAEAVKSFQELTRVAHLLMKIPTLGFAALMVRVQIRTDRLYQLTAEDEDDYASMWKPGLLATLAGLGVWLAIFGIPWLVSRLVAA